MALTLRDLRARLVDVVLAAPQPTSDEASGARWHEARSHADQMAQAVTQPAAHLSFAFSFPRTEFPDLHESSRARRGAAGGRVRTQVVLRWLHRLRADMQREDLDACHDAEALLVKTLCDDVSHADLHLMVQGMSRGLVGDGTFLLCEVEMLAEYRTAIQ